MKIESEIISDVYKFAREFFITMLILYGIIKLLYWEIPTFYLFIVSFFMTVITKIVGDYRVKKATFMIPIIFAVIIIAILVFFSGINIFSFLQQALLWNYQYIIGIKEFNLSYSIITICILSIIIMQIIIRVEKSIKSKFITAIILLIFMIICGINDIQWNAVLTGIMLFYCFDIIVEAHLMKVGGTARYAEACLTQFIALAVFLAICLPSDKEPIKWAWINHTLVSIRDNVQELIYNIEQIGNETKNEFDVKKAGFSEEGTSSFGKLIDGQERNMFFLSIKNSMKTGYLDGVILNTYTGSQWKKNDEGYDNYIEEYKIDLYEKLYNLYHTDLKQSPNEYFAENIHCEIKFDKLETKTIFRPENSYEIYSNSENTALDAIGNNIYFPSKMGKEYSYSIYAVAMNMRNENLKQYLRSLDAKEDYYKKTMDGKGSFDGSLFEQAVKPFKLNNDEYNYIISDNFRRRLYERSKKIKEEYLQTSSGTPERVRKLAEEITKDCTNQYDKAEAICNYLKENYDYTTKINQLPEGKDAVDYFLFDQKKGYCIYFASAMAIMCRYLDIPTRYIDGVALDYSDKDEDWYKVKTKEAHAWTEVYIEGFGWIRMDPTPGYKDIENWKFDSGNWQGYVSQTDKKLNNKIKISVQENEKQTSEENVLGTILLWLKYLFIGLTSLAILILLITGAVIWNKKRIYIKSSNREKIFICMKKIMANLEKQGYVLTKGETLKGFKEKLENDKTFENMDIIKLLEWFQDIRYRSKVITEEDVSRIEHFIASNSK